MSTIHPQPESPAPDPAQDELVAYLDGELSPDECRQVEERLAADADYREQLRELDQAWEALDALPATTPGDDFARTTIEMVTLAAREDQKERTVQATASLRNRRRLWLIIGGVAVVGSFVAARLLLPDANARLIENLPVIMQMDQLAQIQDVEFLRQLSQEVPLDKLATDQAAFDHDVGWLTAASDPAPAARRQWIDKLPNEEKADLADQARQFDSLPKRERDELIDLWRQIDADPDANKLRQTLAAYDQWLDRRTNGEQSRLRSLATDERIRSIRKAIQRESEQAARSLPDADIEALRKEIFRIYDEVKDNEDFARFVHRRERDDRGRRFVATNDEKALFAVFWAMWDNKEIDDRTWMRLKNALSEEAQDHLTQLERRGGERFVKVRLWQWMRDAMHPKRESGEIERYFAEELNENQREHLLSLRRDEMEARLEQMYLGSRFGIQGAEWLGNFGRPGRRGWRPEGPPPGGPGGRRFDRNRRGGPGPGPDGPPDRDGRRRGGPPPDDGPPRPRPDGPPPDGPPPPGPGREEPI